MLLFIVFAFAAFSLYPRHSYLEWRAWASSLGVSMAILAFLAALLSHMWVGLRDVLLDHVKPAGLRHLLLGMVAAGLLDTAVWVLLIQVPVANLICQTMTGATHEAVNLPLQPRA